MSKWHKEAARVIRQIIAEHNPEDAKVFRQLAYEAYPFGERKYTPYKIWSAEVTRWARILGEPAPKPPREFWVKVEQK